jgi:putative membrane protein
MKKIISILGVILFVFAFSSCSNNANKDSVDQAKDMNDTKDSSGTMAAMDNDDSNFMVEAANAGMTEVEMGTMAQQKATDPQVKNFAAMMVRDHTKANDELKSLAATKNVTLPSTVSDDMQKNMNDMRDKKPADFDKDYMDMMVNDHEKVIKKFENTAQNGKDADLKTWASTTLMTLRMHKDSADYIQKMLKNKK